MLLHLLGYKLSLDDLKAFRQLDSKTPGHPEAGHTDGDDVIAILIRWTLTSDIGVEVTTGPLGQGFANGVGLAIAQAHLGAVYNKDEFDLINNYTYGAIVSLCVFPSSPLLGSLHRRWMFDGRCCLGSRQLGWPSPARKPYCRMSPAFPTMVNTHPIDRSTTTTVGYLLAWGDYVLIEDIP